MTRPGIAAVLPDYPFDRLAPVAELARGHSGGIVDLSIGTPGDPTPEVVMAALANCGSGPSRGYPASAGSAAFRDAACEWMRRELEVEVAPSQVGATVGTKEFVAGLPGWLRLAWPGRDIVLYPEVSYPTYAMGAVLAGCQPVPVKIGEDGRMDLASIDPAHLKRALVLWVNSPSNPTGVIEDLVEVARFGRLHGVLVASDECYVELTYSGPRSTVLAQGCDGVLAVHSLSKRSNAAGLRAGFFAGDREVVDYLVNLRKHAGYMVPGPVQAAAVAALGDQEHVKVQRELYYDRLEYFVGVLRSVGLEASLPGGGFYLWVKAPPRLLELGAPAGHGDRPAETAGWKLNVELASRGGILASPGEIYGSAGNDYLRLAMVVPRPRLELAARRLADSGAHLG